VSADWTLFASEHFERRALHARPAAHVPDIDAQQVFEVVSRARPAQPSPTVAVRFLTPAVTDGRQVGDLLPDAADGDFDGYARRIEQTIGDAPYTLVVNGLQSFDVDLWRRSKAFLAPVHEALGGIPPGFASMVAIFGRYPGTPFGVHRDWASTFMFMLSGTKRAWLWERAGEDPTPPSPGDPAWEVEAEPGDMVYWPSATWHILASDPEPSLSLHVVLRFADDVVSEVLRAAGHRIAASSSRTLHPAAPPRGDQVLALADQLPSLEAARRSLAEALESRALEQDLLERWMARCSAGGFLAVPAPRRDVESFEADTVVLRAPDSTLMIGQSAPAELCCAANGHVLRVADTAAVRGALEDLAAGTPLPLGDAGTAVRDVVAWLARVRAVRAQLSGTPAGATALAGTSNGRDRGP
jgi:hypothetical protein